MVSQPAQLEEFSISEPDQIEALGSTVRREIVLYTAATGLSSINEIAHGIGRSATSLYRHVAKLVEVGLLIEAGQETSAGRPRKLYRTPARRMNISIGPDNPEAIEAMCHAVASHLRFAGRALSRVYRANSGRRTGNDRNTRISVEQGWVSKDDLVKINQMIDMINDMTFVDRTDDRTELVNITLAMWPSIADGSGDEEDEDD